MSDKIGLSYPIWCTSPKKIDISMKDFYKLSYFGLGALWCSFKFIFHYTDKGDLKLYLHNYGILEKAMANHRFKNIDWFENSSAEMYNCIIPKDSSTFNTIEKYFKHLIML